jgi:hypothetical protein
MMKVWMPRSFIALSVCCGHKKTKGLGVIVALIINSRASLSIKYVPVHTTLGDLQQPRQKGTEKQIEYVI